MARPPRNTTDVRDALAVYGYLLLTAQQTAKAHAVFKGMHVMFPDDVHVTKSLALTSLATGDPQAAVTLAESVRAAVSEEERMALDVVRGKALHALGRPDEARQLLEAALTARRARTVNGR